ncbi:AAA family ATPase [Phormidesmis sp. 146-33]
MKVKSLTLRSFRGIDNLTLNFDSQINVLIGNNGVGKSSILECLATLLAQPIERVQSLVNSQNLQRSSQRSLKREDIMSGQEETHVDITVSLNAKITKWSLDSNHNEEQLLELSRNILEEIGEQLKVQSADTTQNFNFIIAPDDVKAKLRELAINRELASQAIVDELHNQVKAGGRARLPLVVYYPVNRTVLDVPLSLSENYSSDPIAAHSDALGRGIDFKAFFQWFRHQEDLENELRTQESSYRDNQLTTVRRSIVAFQPALSNLRIKRSPLRMTVQKQGQELIINQLSDGEKCLLAMLGDLARRLAIANPGLPDPLQGEGVVLIDEIELHLHPKWQREIIPALTRTFPNCQFIVTTHSPQVLGEVKGKVYQLKSTPEGIIAESLQTYGRDSNQILEDVMDVSERSPEFQDKLRKLFRLIEDSNLEEAKKLQQELEDLVKYDEPEFAKAEVLIRRKEVLGR